jgi:hypothetical protein
MWLLGNGLSLSNRVGHRRRLRRALAIESLEPRQFFNVSIPTGVKAQALYRQIDGVTDLAALTWTDNNTDETGYRAEWSPNGVDGWATLQTTTSPAAPNAQGAILQATQVLDAGQKYFYRVRALDGANDPSAPSAIVSPRTGVDTVVQLTATAATDGGSALNLDVQLSWVPISPYSPADVQATAYTVYSRLAASDPWDLLATLPATATGYGDQQSGSQTREYKVERLTSAGSAFGYVSTGASVVLPDARGTALLVVDETMASALAGPLLQFAYDLIGDGWSVQRIDVARLGTVASVKQAIQDVYAQYSDLRSIVLIGHVPVPYSGLNVSYDRHSDHYGAWPADAYYGDLISSVGDWPDIGTRITNVSGGSGGLNLPGDGKFDLGTLPSAIEAAVGRIDFANLNLNGEGSTEWEKEAILLARYLQKNHEFRTRLVAPPLMRALVDDQLGLSDAAAWRGLSPLVGPSNISYRDWSSTLATDAYLWAYGGGPGSATIASGVIGSGQYGDNAAPIGAVFNMLYGSYFGDWNLNDDLLRSAIASKGPSLAAMWAGDRPAWFMQPMGLGEPIGNALLLTQNNPGTSATYQPGSYFQNGVNIALMGDPTLRMSYVAPPTNVQSEIRTADSSITWDASPDAVARYNIYRAIDGNGPFALVGEATGTSFTYSAAGWDDPAQVFMIRAVKLEQTPSGNYYNMSQGAFSAPPKLSSNVVSGGSGNDTFTIRIRPDDRAYVDIVTSLDGRSAETITIAKALLPSITIRGLGGDDQLTIDNSYGTNIPFPAGGINFDGGAGSDTIVLNASGYRSDITITGGIINVVEQGATRGDVVLSGTEYATINGAWGDDSLTLYSPAPIVQFNANVDANADELRVAGGAATILGTSLASTKIAMRVDAGASAIFASSQRFESLTIDGKATIASGGDKVNANKSLSIAGQLDVTDNDLLIDYTGSTIAGTWTGSGYTGVSGLVASGFNGGAWNGNGIVSSMADASDAVKLVGVAEAADLLVLGANATTTWDGFTVDATTVLIKYTQAGDPGGWFNADGYARIDFYITYPPESPSWLTGDFNYDGQINADDYALIDLGGRDQQEALQTRENPATLTALPAHTLEHAPA